MFQIPTPEETMTELASDLPLIYGALDHAIQKTLAFFEREDPGKRVNRDLAPDLVRWWAKQYLQAHGREVKDEQEVADEQDYMVKLPNNGLCLKIGRCMVRILKSDDGDLPIPGSRGRVEFYYQPNLAFPEENGTDSKSVPLKLLILWNVTSSYNLDFLSLACPMSGDLTRTSVKAHWHERIPDSFLGIASHIDVTPIAPVEEESRDLPLADDEEEQHKKKDKQSGEIG